MNLASIIDGHPDENVALVHRGRPITYRELRDLVAGFRGSLVELGVEPGQRVAILCGNSPEFVITYLATVGLGAVAVPVNPTSPAPELGRELAAVEPTVAVLDPTVLEAWRDVDPAVTGALTHVVASEGHDLAGALTFEALTGGAPVGVVDVEPDRLAVLLFTSGTASTPRAAMLSHGNLRSNIEQSLSIPDRLGPADVVYGVLPMFHIFGLNVVLGLTLAAGATVVLVERFDPATALDTIVDRGVTVMPGAPPMWVAWSQFGDLPREAFGRLRFALTGAAKMPEEVTRTLEERFGLKLREGYGLTEAAPVVTTSVGTEPRVGSIGQVVEGVQLKLVDSDGDEVLAGDPGEIWVKGPNVFLGYWNDPEATARALTPDGWLRTADIAVTDEDGYLYLVDRARDLIIVSGFNVYPAEVEAAISEMEGVAEVAVVGVPHPQTGEAIRAFVVCEPGVQLSEHAVIHHVGGRLARYKCPTKVSFVDDLPKSAASGKLLRRELR